MIYKRFEELPVWNAAIELALGAYRLTSHVALGRRRSLRDQIERAALSVSNNIAEGFERGTNEELLTFLFITRGSAGEVRSILCLMERLEELDAQKASVRALKARAEGVSKQLGAWIRSIQNPEKKGERFVTDKVRRTDERKKERDEFLARLREMSGRGGGPQS